MQRLLSLLAQFAPHDHVAIVLEGESGVGKTLLARYVHNCSPRGRRQFIGVDLGAMDDGFAGSALFGHLAGSYTGAREKRHGAFASASGGSLFLDEIGKASVAVQQKMLTAIEIGHVVPLGSDRAVPTDARVIAATNIPLRELVARGTFLADLFARLEHFRIPVPPLRERREDIPELVEGMIAKWAPRSGYLAAQPRVHPGLMRLFTQYDWPNNLRELDGSLRRLLIEAAGAPTLTREHWARIRDEPSEPSPTSCDRSLRHHSEVTDEEIRLALIETKGSRLGASEHLRISRTSLRRRIDRMP